MFIGYPGHRRQNVAPCYQDRRELIEVDGIGKPGLDQLVVDGLSEVQFGRPLTANGWLNGLKTSNAVDVSNQGRSIMHYETFLRDIFCEQSGSSSRGEDSS